MGTFYDRKRKGLCTKCGINKATGARMILCDVCRNKLKMEHDNEADITVKYFHGERG